MTQHPVNHDGNDDLFKKFAIKRRSMLPEVTMMSPGLQLPCGAGGDSSSGKAKARAIAGHI